MLKKVAMYVVLGVVVVAIIILVHLFVTKGYQAVTNPVVTTPVGQTNTVSPGGTSLPSQTTGTVPSEKISLVITSPKDGDTLGSTNVVVKGKTSPNADVFVDDQSGKADASGNFSISVGLDEGKNQIVVSANDATGNATEQDLTVNVASFQ